MTTNLIFTLIILAIAVIAGVSALLINQRKRLMTRPKSQPQAAEWWSSLEKQWCTIFKAAIGINREPTADELVSILSLTVLKCNGKELTHLEPLRALTGLQKLGCRDNRLTSLEPLWACLGLRVLHCGENQLTSLKPLRALTGLRTLVCYYNHLTSLESLHGVKNLQYLWCKKDSFLSEPEIERFKKAAPSGLRVLSPSWRY